MESLTSRYDKSKLLYLPCGSCISCRIAKSKEWAVRCVLEAKAYKSNFFITLTYNNASCPEKLDKEALTKFLKKLQRLYPGMRYFSCGEYGSKNGRPHYHAILFNFDPPDLTCLGKTKNGYYFESKSINAAWSHGYVMLADFSYHTAAYIARYTMKKLLSDDKKDEFLVMSLKPGIGASYFEKNYKAIYSDDVIYGKFGNSFKAPIPRYFDKLLERIDIELFTKIKSERLSCANLDHIDYMIKHNLHHYEEVYDHKDKANILKYKKLAGRRL